MDSYEIAIEEGLIVILPEGDIVSRAYIDIENIVADNMYCGRTNVVLNMERVVFVDSAGIIFLLRLKKIVECNGGHLEFYNMKCNVENILRKLQLDKILNISVNAEDCFIKVGSYVAESRNIKVNVM